MKVLPILKYGNEILHRKAEPINNINEAIVELAQKMVQTMHAAPGIGLAAPQVGVGKRLITIDLSVGKDPSKLIILINPEILEEEGEEILEEGCLSLPGISENVARPSKILVKGIDLDGKERKIEAFGILARAFCHEVDHLNGKFFIDRLSYLKRNLIKRKILKQIKEGKW
ncbi:peptide deformylase [Candidatus Aminicenantes bacterium AC-335-A11]|jgi:peptide deformylase|nr:peptide deformylase [SCandidatus Aminicenantes bacterium Aminicenantia_JdfR_composite]MCP2597585.1 peptide deformylase [Candidatus Aminicenantes bacterium AC-335-G13]MCP2618415.1 peptide deformylase [Candidatus Aminicenantes bacterium AC-335-A11]MCP2620722.1 peptide deformylase [Candidatus Aminicenantes bacterium AC-334-E05]